MVNQSKSRSTTFIATPLLIAVALIIGIVVGQRSNKLATLRVLDDSGEQPVNALGTGRVEEVIRYVDARYVEEEDDEKMIKDAIHGVLENLDPHSSYIPADHLKEVNENLKGGFSGIGVEYLILDDTLTVLRTLPDGPSLKAGILPHDRIVAVDDSVIINKKLDAKGVGNLLRGQRGSEVKVTVWRPSERAVKEITIIRGEIPNPSVDVGFMVDDKTGYVKVNRFSATTHKEFMKQVERMVKNEGMKNIIIDLRQNPGGYLEEATKMLNQLFKLEGTMLVYTEGKNGKNEYKTTGHPLFDIDNVVVLVDEGSASASEIFAGAIQDDDRGVIVGRRTFGKGLVQEQYPLSDGSALRLTIAKYYTPSGRCIQKPYEDAAHYNNEFAKRLESGEMVSGKKIAVLDSTEYHTVGGDVVYGGGGIIPDIYVPFDTTVFFTQTYTEAIPFVRLFAFRYAEAHQQDIKNVKNFRITNDILDAFYAYAKEKGAKINESELPTINKEIAKDLKAYIVRYHLMEQTNEQFYRIYLQGDEVLEAGREILQERDPVGAARRR